MKNAFLHFGGAATVDPQGPMQTVSVEVKHAPMDWHNRGLTYTATGYGPRIPSEYMVKWAGRWRRVYVACFGNSGSAYIGKPGAWLATVSLES